MSRARKYLRRRVVIEGRRTKIRRAVVNVYVRRVSIWMRKMRELLGDYLGKLKGKFDVNDVS
jgi:hypothetical protein